MADTDARDRERAQAYFKRKRMPSRGELAGAVGFAIGTNLLVLGLLATGKLNGLQLLVLLIAEAVVLGIVAMLELVGVPKAHRPDAPRGLFGQLLLMLVIFAGLSALQVFFIANSEPIDVEVALRDWRSLLYDWALLVPLAAVTIEGLWLALEDRRQYRELGPPFLSAVAIASAPRVMTLVMASVPPLVPMLLLAGIVNGVEQLRKPKAQRDPDKDPTIALPLFGAVALAGAVVWFGGLGGWWLAMFFATKFGSEVAFAFFPQMMQEDLQKLGGSAGGARKGRLPG